MKTRSSTYMLAGWSVYAVAALLFLFCFLVGFSVTSLWFLVPALVFGTIGFGLIQGMRWVAWITFPLVLVAGNAALMFLSVGLLPDAWLMGFAMINGIAAVALFVVLWRHHAGWNSAR